MEVFFNELSVRPAPTDTEARQWLETLAELGKSLRDCVESLSDNAFTFRRSEDFGQLSLTATQTVLEFLQAEYDYDSAVYNFLLGVFDSPYITENDPQRTEYEYTSLTFLGTDHSVTGLAAAYLKNALAVSLDSDTTWNTCQLAVQINRLDADTKEVSSAETIEHASRKQHLLDCHLPRLANLYNWQAYRPRFDSDAKTQTLLSLVGLYGLHVESWNLFYDECRQLPPDTERIVAYRSMAEKIATVQRWEPATGNLKTRNPDRTIYTIPNSLFIVSVDTQHGEFEVHRKQQGNNHLGAISFDGLRFKSAIATRKLLL